MMLDPDGEKTIISVDSNNIITDLDPSDYDLDNKVYLKLPNGSEKIIGLQPPRNSYLYDFKYYPAVLDKPVSCQFGVVGNKFIGDVSKLCDANLSKAVRETNKNPKNILKWGTGLEYDIKNTLGINNVAVNQGFVGTGRDIGNFDFGRFGYRMFFGVKNFLYTASDVYARKQAIGQAFRKKRIKDLGIALNPVLAEDESSYSSQEAGFEYEKKKNKDLIK